MPDINVTLTEAEQIQVVFNDIVNGTVIDSTFINKISALFKYDIARNSTYGEITYSGDDVSRVRIWETAGKTTELFDINLVYNVDGNLETATILDTINNKTLTIVLSYDVNENVTSFSKDYS